MAEAIKGKQNTDGNDKLIAFAKILDDIQSIGAPLKNIERNTAVLPKLVAMLAKAGNKTTSPAPPSYYQKATRAASERKRDEKGRFVPSKPVIASKPAKLPQPAQQHSFVIAKPSLPKPINDRVKMPTKAIMSVPVAVAASAVPEVIQKKVARQNKAIKAASSVTSIAEASPVTPSQRDSKGRFQGSIAQQAQTDSKAARQANDEKKTLSQSIKDGFKTVGGHAAGALKDGVQSVDTKEAAGQAAGGPLYSAGKELYGAAQDIKEKANDESTLLGKAWKGVKTKTGMGNKDKSSGAVVSEIKASENKEDKRHKELLSAVKAIDSGAQHSEAGGGYGMPRVTRTGPGSSQKPGKIPKEKPSLKNALKRGADGKLSIKPKAGGGGIGGGLLARGAGALMGGGGMLAGLTSMIGPAIAVAVAGAAIGTGISKLLDMGAQKLTGDKNATAGGAFYDFLHPGTGKDTKFENKYQQYQGDVQASSQKYGVSEGYMKTMMKIESGGDPNAVSSTGAKGLYQFTGGTAKGYGIKGQEFNPSANIDAAARLARDNAAQLQRSGIAVNDSNMYMSHQLGVGGIGKGGLKDLLNSSQTGAPVSDALRKQMDVNGGQGMDAQAFLGMWRKKWINTAQSVGADPNSMARGKQPTVTPTTATGSPEYEKQLAEFKAKEGAVATPPATTSTGTGSRKKKGKGRGKQDKPAPIAADEVAKQEEYKPVEKKKQEAAIGSSREGEQTGSEQKASAVGPAVTEVVSGNQKDQQAATEQSGNSVKAGSAPAKPDYAGKAEKMFKKVDAELPLLPSAAAPVAPAPAPVQPPLEAVATKAPAMSYDDQQAAREGIQKDYWVKEDARRAQSGEAFKQVKGQQTAITAEKEAMLSDIEKRRKEVDAKYDAGGLNDAEAGKQQVALDAEAEQVKKEHLAKMGDAITGGFKGVDAQSGQLLAEKDAKGKALDAQIAGVTSQTATTPALSRREQEAQKIASEQQSKPTYQDKADAIEAKRVDAVSKINADTTLSDEEKKQKKAEARTSATKEAQALKEEDAVNNEKINARLDAADSADAEAKNTAVATPAETAAIPAKDAEQAQQGKSVEGQAPSQAATSTVPEAAPVASAPPLAAPAPVFDAVATQRSLSDAVNSGNRENASRIAGAKAEKAAKDSKLQDIADREAAANSELEAKGASDADFNATRDKFQAEREALKKPETAEAVATPAGSSATPEARAQSAQASNPQTAVPVTAVASSPPPVIPAPAPIQPPPPAPVTANVPEVSQLAAAMQNQQQAGSKTEGTSTVTQSSIKTEFDDTMLTLMAYDRI